MVASFQTTVGVCDVLEQMLGPTLALDMIGRLEQVPGNQSYKDTIRNVKDEMEKRKAERGHTDELRCTASEEGERCLLALHHRGPHRYEYTMER